MKVMTVGQITSRVGIGETIEKGKPPMLDDLVKILLRYPHIYTIQKHPIRK
jgi:uncharacterized membrane protein YGL010W